jgi:hypothetical protein
MIVVGIDHQETIEGQVQSSATHFQFGVESEAGRA